MALTGPEGRYVVDPNIRAFVAVGLCGGYTTFSAFSLQSMVLMQEGEWLQPAPISAAPSSSACWPSISGHVIATQLSAL